MKVDRPVGPAAPEAQPPVGEAKGATEPSVPFADRLGRSDAATGAAGVDPAGIEALVQRVRSGEIELRAALDVLVEQAVAGAPLGPAGKQELRELLRSALEADPALRRLAREIEQG